MQRVAQPRVPALLSPRRREDPGRPVAGLNLHAEGLVVFGGRGDSGGGVLAALVADVTVAERRVPCLIPWSSV